MAALANGASVTGPPVTAALSLLLLMLTLVSFAVYVYGTVLCCQLSLAFSLPFSSLLPSPRSRRREWNPISRTHTSIPSQRYHLRCHCAFYLSCQLSLSLSLSPFLPPLLSCTLPSPDCIQPESNSAFYSFPANHQSHFLSAAKRHAFPIPTTTTTALSTTIDSISTLCSIEPTEQRVEALSWPINTKVLLLWLLLLSAKKSKHLSPHIGTLTVDCNRTLRYSCWSAYNGKLNYILSRQTHERVRKMRTRDCY